MTTPDIVPVATFFATPRFSRAQISPDGRHLAYLAPWRGRLNVFTAEIGGTDGGLDQTRRVTADRHRNIEGFCWSRDSADILFLQDANGDENWHLHRATVAADQPEPVDLTPIPGVRVMEFAFSSAEPGVILLQMNARSPALIDLHRLDLATGELTTIAQNPGRFVRWLPIPGGTIHAVVVNADGDYDLTRYQGGAFVPIATFAGADMPFGPLPCVATPDGKGLWIGSNRRTDRTRLVRIDLATGEETEIDSHAVFDLDTPRPEADPRFPPCLVLNSVTDALLGARYLGERQVIHALDPQFAAVLAKLEGLSAGDIGHLSCDAEGLRWIAEFTTDRDPGTTWFYDHATGESRIVGSRQPGLEPSRLSPVRPLTVMARDGLALPCHLTLPANGESSRLPTVVLVHGGPWYRDSASYDPEVQFLANRGYAVLQVNFRGSTGYGKAFMQAARGEFAGRMHDDLVDALDWAITEGITDPDRVAIYGCSYGGYAALVGAAFTPDRFAAAISYSGMSDLRVLVEGAVPFVRETLINSYLTYMGDPDVPEDNVVMLARSPVSRLDRIRCPLLVVHGAQDVRVALDQAETVVDELRGRNNEVEFLVNPNEGHWFINEDSNFELYRTIERFLMRHIGGRSGEEVPPVAALDPGSA
jgi:dipeptidyl aminopeptidase/acylaminoacyl peptidase